MSSEKINEWVRIIILMLITVVNLKDLTILSGINECIIIVLFTKLEIARSKIIHLNNVIKIIVDIDNKYYEEIIKKYDNNIKQIFDDTKKLLK